MEDWGVAVVALLGPYPRMQPRGRSSGNRWRHGGGSFLSSCRHAERAVLPLPSTLTNRRQHMLPPSVIVYIPKLLFAPCLFGDALAIDVLWCRSSQSTNEPYLKTAAHHTYNPDTELSFFMVLRVNSTPQSLKSSKAGLNQAEMLKSSFKSFLLLYSFIFKGDLTSRSQNRFSLSECS